MNKKLISAPMALVATLALAAGPVSADDTTTGDVTTACVDDTTTDATVADPTDTDLDVMIATAEDAAAAAPAIAEEEANGTDDSCVTLHDRAVEALTAAVARLGTDENGVASQILQMLIDGKSPAGIGAEYGKDMAEAGVARREQHQAEGDNGEHGRPAAASEAGRPESSTDVEHTSTDDGTDTGVDDSQGSDDVDETVDDVDTDDEIGTDDDTDDEFDHGSETDAGAPEGVGHP